MPVILNCRHRGTVTNLCDACSFRKTPSQWVCRFGSFPPRLYKKRKINELRMTVFFYYGIPIIPTAQTMSPYNVLMGNSCVVSMWTRDVTRLTFVLPLWSGLTSRSSTNCTLRTQTTFTSSSWTWCGFASETWTFFQFPS